MSEHVRRTWVVANKWTCTSCGQVNDPKDTLDNTHCSKCGSVQEADEAAAAVLDPTNVVTDPEHLKRAAEGPEWTCDYCGGRVRNVHGNCAVGCGAARNAEPTQKTSGRPPEPPRAPRTRAPTPPPQFGGTRYRKPAETFAADFYPDEPVPSFKRPSWVAPVVLGGGALALIVFLAWLFWPHETTAKVVGGKWMHTTRYQERVTLSGSGWDGDMPFGAFNTRCETRLKGHRDCNPYQCNPYQESYNCNSYSCNCRTSCTPAAQGKYSTCQERCSTCYRTCTRTAYRTCYKRCPVYDDWCDYNYHQWQPRGERTASGNLGEPLQWPSFTPIDETHRETRHPSYIVHFVDTDGDKHSDDPDGSSFVRYAVGQQCLCKKSIAGTFSVVSCH